jgi:hypothetical protein
MMDPKSTKGRTARPEARATRKEARVPIDSDAIARRAYALYEARGRTPGHEHEDWLLAERQLLEEREAPVPAAPARTRRRERPKEAEA